MTRSTPNVLTMGVSVFVKCGLHNVQKDLIATLKAILPSFIVVLTVTVFFRGFGSGPVMRQVFGKVHPTMITLVTTPAFDVTGSTEIGQCAL